jgi:hypothetical protein
MQSSFVYTSPLWHIMSNKTSFYCSSPCGTERKGCATAKDIILRAPLAILESIYGKLISCKYGQWLGGAEILVYPRI